MASKVGPLQVAALGVFLFAGYELLQPILHAHAAAAAGGAAASTGGGTTSTSPSAPAPSASNWQPLSLTDAGSYPFPLESLGARVRQRADLGGTNEYHVGAVFLDGGGASWQWTGGTNLVNVADGSAATFGDFPG